MSVLERHIAFRIPRQCPRERKGCSCSRRHRQSSALLTAVRGRAAGPAVDRPGPSVRPAPVVAATAGLVMADQDSSPDPAGRPPRHPRVQSFTGEGVRGLLGRGGRRDSGPGVRRPYRDRPERRISRQIILKIGLD
jgi:hypothetical protein